MVEPLSSIGPQGVGPGGPPTPAPGAKVGEKSFKDILTESINEVNRMQVDADKAVESLVTGQTNNVDEVVSAVKKAELAFDTLMQIRNKLVDAFEQVMQMRI